MFKKLPTIVRNLRNTSLGVPEIIGSKEENHGNDECPYAACLQEFIEIYDLSTNFFAFCVLMCVLINLSTSKLCYKTVIKNFGLLFLKETKNCCVVLKNAYGYFPYTFGDQ